MVIIPLILASIIRGLASSSDIDQMKKIGGWFSLFVLASSALSSFVGVTLTKLIAPGANLKLTLPTTATKTVEQGGSFFSPETIVGFLPSNPLMSIVEGQMMEVVVISIIMGIALLSIKADQARSVMELLGVVQELCMTIISWAMKLAPYAVFGMMVQVAATTGVSALQSMGMYVSTSFLGYLIVIIFYLIVVLIFTRMGPITFLKKASTPMLLAFSTSSSAATMPSTMKVAEEEFDCEPSVSRFLIPLGTTVNMAGSAIWHTTAIIFVAQAYQVNLSIGQILFVAATSIGSAIGSPGVPGVGIGVLATVLAKIGIPAEGLALIMGVDRLVDMGCTVVNVTGDMTASYLFGRKK